MARTRQQQRTRKVVAKKATRSNDPLQQRGVPRNSTVPTAQERRFTPRMSATRPAQVVSDADAHSNALDTATSPIPDEDEDEGLLLSPSSPDLPTIEELLDEVRTESQPVPAAVPAAPVVPAAAADDDHLPHPMDASAFTLAHRTWALKGPASGESWHDTTHRKIEALAHKLRRDKQFRARPRKGTRNGHVTEWGSFVREYAPTHSKSTWSLFFRAYKTEVIERIGQLDRISAENGIA